MIDALVSGRLIGQATARTARNGSPFATAKVRAADAKGEPVIVSVITFSRSTVEALLALGDGDSVALAGELSARTYQDKHGAPRPALDLQAHAALSTYAVQRRRKAIAAAKPEPEPAGAASADPEPFIDDELPLDL